MISCKISVLASDICKKPWEYIKDTDSEIPEIYDIERIQKIICHNKIIRQGNGFVCQIYGKCYVITCQHIIGDVYDEIFMMINPNMVKIKLTIFASVKEFDIIILCLSDSKDIDLQQIPEISMTSIKQIIANKDKIKLVSDTNINISDIKIECDYLKSKLLPPIPLIKFKSDTLNIEGLSGCCVIVDTNIVGMLTSIHNGMMEAIPISIIYLFVSTSIIRGTPKLYGLPITTQVVDIESDDVCSMTCHMIDRAINDFNQDDIICSINQTPFNSDGTINSSDFDYQLPLNTWLMFEFLKKKSLSFEIQRLIGRDYKKIIKKSEGILYDTIYNVNISDTYKYLYWKGIIFTELSEELIYKLKKLKYNTDSNIFKQYHIPTNSSNKYVVVVDVCYKVLKKILPSKMINIDNIITQISDIGKKKINNLDSLNNILMSDSASKLFNKLEKMKLFY